MTKTGFWSDFNDRLDAFREVSNGKVFVGDTDTIPGLYAPLTREGFQALNDIKGRQDKPYLILVNELQKIEQWAIIPEQKNFRALLQKLWPGPLTVLLKARETTPDFMKGAYGTIAFRIPAHKDLLEFLKMVDGVFSTSANLSGEPFPETTDSVNPAIVQHVDLIMQGGVELRVPSTIIDCSTGTCKIVREGSIPAALIQQLVAD